MSGIAPDSPEAVRAAIEEGWTLVGYERANGLRGLAPVYYAEEVALGIAADLAPSLFAADGSPDLGRNLGGRILAARANGVRWSRISVYLGLPEKEVREKAEKAGLSEDHYVGLGRRYGREGTAVRRPRRKAAK